MSVVRVFEYLDRLDAFVVTDEYSLIAERLGLAEWNPVVWIGRLFALDNDYGEHWFDNWGERAFEHRPLSFTVRLPTSTAGRLAGGCC